MSERGRYSLQAGAPSNYDRQGQNGRRMNEKETFLKNIPFITFEVIIVKLI